MNLLYKITTLGHLISLYSFVLRSQRRTVCSGLAEANEVRNVTPLLSYHLMARKETSSTFVLPLDESPYPTSLDQHQFLAYILSIDLSALSQHCGCLDGSSTKHEQLTNLKMRSDDIIQWHI